MGALRKSIYFVVVAPLALVALLLIANAYERHRLNERMQYWAVEMQQGLPKGTPRPVAQEFFLARGIPLACGKAVLGLQTCTGREKEEYGSLPTWHVRFKLLFVNDSLVSAEHIAFGIGL